MHPSGIKPRMDRAGAGVLPDLCWDISSPFDPSGVKPRMDRAGAGVLPDLCWDIASPFLAAMESSDSDFEDFDLVEFECFQPVPDLLARAPATKRTYSDAFRTRG